MEFLYISSLGTTYRYVIKIVLKLKQKTQKFGPGNPSQQKPGKGGPIPPRKGQSKYGQYQDNHSKLQAKKDTGKTKKDIQKWCDFHKRPWHNTIDCRSKQSLDNATIVELPWMLFIIPPNSYLQHTNPSFLIMCR